MKILVASSSAPDRGAGISTYCREIALGLKNFGHDVIYASPLPDDFSWLDSVALEYIETPFDRNMLALCKSILRKIEAEKIDAIINNDNAVIQNIAALVRCPFISVGHLDSTTIGSMLTHNKDWVDYTVAISSDMQLNLVKKLDFPPTRIPLVHNGISDIDTSLISKKTSGGKLKVIFGGGLIPRKGGDIISRLLRMSKSEPNIQFNIFGELPRGVPKDMISCDQIVFHGRQSRDEFMLALASADVFLLPSRSEGCPMALLEALAYGCVPIVSNGIGAMRWIVSNADNGYVCRLDSWAENTFEVLKLLHSNRSELKRMSSAARNTFESDFKVEKTVGRLLYLLSVPTVDRSVLPVHPPLIHWHRWPAATIKQRIFYRVGFIERAGEFS